MEQRSGLRCSVTYVLHKSCASGQPAARWLPAAWNADGMFSPPPLSHGPGSPKRPSLPGGAGSASHPWCSADLTPTRLSQRETAGPEPPPNQGSGSGPEQPRVDMAQAVRLGQGLANSKGPCSKYFGLCGTCSLRGKYSALPW